MLLCTYNRTLAGALEAQLRRLASPEVVARIDVLGVDQAVNRTVREEDRDVPRLADGRLQERLWADAVASADVPVLWRELCRYGKKPLPMFPNGDIPALKMNVC